MSNYDNDQSTQETQEHTPTPAPTSALGGGLGGKIDPKKKSTTGVSPSGKPVKKSSMMPIYLAMAGVLLAICLGLFFVISNNSKKQAQAEQARALALEQEQQQAELEAQAQAEQEKAVNGLDADLINYIDEKMATIPNYWVIERTNNDGTKADPFLLLAHQATESTIAQNPFYNHNPVGVKSLEGEVVAIDDSNPQGKAVYESGVIALRNIIAQSYDLKIEDILVNNGANLARGAIITPKDTGVQISNVPQFEAFEQWVMTQALTNTSQIVQKLQDIAPEKEPEVPAETQAMIDNERMKQIIEKLNGNLEQARRENEDKARQINELSSNIQKKDESMAKFLQQLENNPNVNTKLNYSTLAKQAPNLKTMSVIGDRVFLQDNHGIQYSAKVGDVIALPNGRKLTLVNADTQTVIIEK